MAQITYENKVALNQNPNIADINKVNDTDMNMIKNAVNDNETKILIAVADTAPEECETGDMYYNTTDNLIYTATSPNTWGTTGIAPTENTIYVVIDTQISYIYDGTTLVSIGGGASGGGKTPVGSITLYAGDTAPSGYMLCDGSAISRTDYADLYNIIGTIYGDGDGSTTFNLPNLKGNVPVGLNSSDTSFNTLGKAGGEKTHTLTINEMPRHRHQFDAYRSVSRTTTDTPVVAWENDLGDRGKYTMYEGGSQAHNNLQPYIVLNYIIKY